MRFRDWSFIKVRMFSIDCRDNWKMLNVIILSFYFFYLFLVIHRNSWRYWTIKKRWSWDVCGKSETEITDRDIVRDLFFFLICMGVVSMKMTKPSGVAQYFPILFLFVLKLISGYAETSSLITQDITKRRVQRKIRIGKNTTKTFKIQRSDRCTKVTLLHSHGNVVLQNWSFISWFLDSPPVWLMLEAGGALLEKRDLPAPPIPARKSYN